MTGDVADPSAVELPVGAVSPPDPALGVIAPFPEDDPESFAPGSEVEVDPAPVWVEVDPVPVGEEETGVGGETTAGASSSVEAPSSLVSG